MTSLETKLEAAKKEQAYCMEQIGQWNARAQRVAGSIETLTLLIKEEGEKTEASKGREEESLEVVNP